jgi:pimeloyl-ACP methyl ester carboxylesterase
VKRNLKSITMIGFLALIFLAISPAALAETVIRIKPLKKSEIRAIHNSLVSGQPLKESALNRDSGDETTCEIPAFFGLNRQGYVTVPEDYDNPNGRQIKVFYYGRVQTDRDPVVFFNGGPGSDSHGSAQIIEGDFIQSPEVHQLSFIYIDQRGTGCSDAFPSEPTPETIQRLTHYTSDNIVRDSEAVRETLFGAGSQWKVFGQSFGGLIVHRYALTAPQSIKGAYAHGFSLMKDQSDWLTMRIKSQKRVLELYFQTYPGDRAKLASIRQQIADDLCFTDEGTKVCGPKVIDAMTMFLGFSSSWPYMNATIKNLLAADGSLNSAALTKFVRNYVFGTYNNNALAGSVISMSEISDGESDQIACTKVNQKLVEQGETPDQWLINECRLLAGMTNDKWAELLKDVKNQKQMTPEMLKEALVKNPKLPFFLYSGQKDVFVPVETFTEEVDLVGSLLTYRSFPNSGHEGFHTERQVWKDLVSIH